jgi:hypothetical protein
MGERCFSKVSEAQQGFVRNLSHLADGLKARGL